MIDSEKLIQRCEKLLAAEYHKDLETASAAQLHNSLSKAAMEALAPLWMSKEKERAGKRQAYYMSAEYLLGRLVYNNLFSLGILEEVRTRLQERGVDLAALEDIEDDALGNGGLGRLAACFLDSAATHDIPLTGYGLRYRFGLFKQSFVDNRQHEEPDDWERSGDPWSIRRDDLAVIVHMKTGDVLAVPYDMPVVGYGCKNIGTLRLWQSESLKEIDFDLFNEQKYVRASASKNQAEDITKFLYPNDDRRAGKLMRVKQQYLLVSASLQDMLAAYHRRHGKDYSFFASEHAVQLNDTHPTMAIPELIRLLMLDGIAFEEAFLIGREVFSYTNHTVMQEALEKWDLSLLSSVCPDLVTVIRMIDSRFREESAKAAANLSETEAKPYVVTEKHCIIYEKRVHMAQLAVYATHATNGVAELHTEILKNSVFADWYTIYPERFRNKTNGITQRRWLGLCNPELSAFLTERLGSNAFMTDLYALKGLKRQIDGPEGNALAEKFAEIKRQKKIQLAEAIDKETGVVLSPDMVFDVQIKRLHEYKRQLLNAFSILAIYQKLKKGELPDWTPTAFIFGAKAAPGYRRAKAVIYLINCIAEKVNADPETSDRLKVVFVPNYNCSWAEKIIPAADISEQISAAGTEASGTGNMKFMLNGAVTLGTYDGANIEIAEQAGRENNYIFGATVEELTSLRPNYAPKEIYAKDKLIHDILDQLTDGTFPDTTEGLAELRSSILDGASWHAPDQYFLLADFHSYLDAKIRANREYTDRIGFSRKCLYNIAAAGKFSSDRTIQEYAEDIWKV